MGPGARALENEKSERQVRQERSIPIPIFRLQRAVYFARHCTK